MKKSILLLTMFFGSLFPGCKSSKYTPSTYPDLQIIFGKGGGISGAINEYCVFENGTVFKRQGMMNAPFEKIGRLSQDNIRQLLDNMETLKVTESEFTHPGNLYSYVEIKNHDSPTRITWGHEQIPVPDNIQLYFDLLNHHVTNLN